MCFGCHGIFRTALTAAVFLLAAASCSVYPTFLAAAEVVHLSIGEKQGVYHLALATILDAPFAAVRHVITDYAHIYRVDPSIVKSEVLSKPGASITRVETVADDCILYFCRDIRLVEDVKDVKDDDIYTVIVPELSSVKSGTGHWQILPVGPKTRINYDMTLQPGFYVPPLIASYLVEKKLEKEVSISLDNIERIARTYNQRLMAHDLMQNVTWSSNTAREHDTAA